MGLYAGWRQGCDELIRDFFYQRNDRTVLLYVFSVLIFSMSVSGPILSGVSYAAALLSRLYTGGKKAFAASVAVSVPVLLLLMFINPLVNTGGLTVLFVVFGRSITAESVLYGLSNGLMLSSVLIWFFHWNDLSLSEKLLGVFSGFLPTTTLSLVMILRYIPDLIRTAAEVDRTQKALCGLENKRIETIRLSLRTATVVLEKSLEDSILTAKSMMARGYRSGMKRRKPQKMTASDRFLTIVILSLLIINAVLLFAGGSFIFYPYVSIPPVTPISAGFLAALLLLPILCDGKDAIKWLLWK